MVTIYGPDSENVLLTLKCVTENQLHFQVLYRWNAGCRFLFIVRACVFFKNKPSGGIFTQNGLTLLSKAVLSFGTSWTSQVTFHLSLFSSALTELS